MPATYGGVERHVEEVGARLAGRGHEVTVFCRANYVTGEQESYRGMHLRVLPVPASKHLEAITHSMSSSIQALRGYDIVHYHAIGPTLASPMVRLGSRARVVATIHGLDGDRAKWGGGAQMVLRAGTRLSAMVPHATVVVSRALVEHYSHTYGRRTHHVPNGVTAPCPVSPGGTLADLKLSPRGYVLFVGRLVPEKAPDTLLRAFRRLDTQCRLVMVGGSSFTDDYVAGLRELAGGDDRVVLPGYLYAEQLRELYSNAALFVLPSYLEGLPLTLLEACSYGLPAVASSIEPHREVLREDGPGRRYFDAGDVEGLTESLRLALEDLDAERDGAEDTKVDVLRRYDWDRTTDELEQLYWSLKRT